MTVLSDPLAATVLAAGFRLRRPRVEKTAVAIHAAGNAYVLTLMK